MAVSIELSATQNSQNITNNTSSVTVKLKCIWTNGSFNHYSPSGSVTINGTKYSFSANINPNKTTSGSNTIFSRTVTITHNTNGTKELSCSASFTTGISSGTVTDTLTKTLSVIPRAAEVTAVSNFNDEENPTITYSNPAGWALEAAIYTSNASSAIASYRSIGTSKSGTYTFTLTDAERTRLRSAVTSGTTGKVRFYIRRPYADEGYQTDYITKSFSLIDAMPTVRASVTDTNTATTALTGNSNALVRYHSNAKLTITATAKKGATIQDIQTKQGTVKTGSTPTFNAIESNQFAFTVIDSRNNVTKLTLGFNPYYEYIKPTSNLKLSLLSTNGDLDFTINGHYWDDTFGKVANSLSVQYRYKADDGEYTDWIDADYTITDNKYTSYVSISGLNYLSVYTFQARAKDALNDVLSAEKVTTAVPVFDWSKDDFNFNVNVNLKNNIKINGITTDNQELNAFQPCNGNNNCVLGYGGYTEEIGATNVYGNDLNLLTNTDLTVNDGSDVFSILGAMRALTNVYELETTVTAGTNYTDCEATAYLIGNNLRMYITATRKSNANVGDVSNEEVMTIKVKHDGKIKSMYGTSFASGTTGAPATFHAASQKTDDNNHTITISLCGVSVADNGWSGYWCLPCTLDLAAYI